MRRGGKGWGEGQADSQPRSRFHIVSVDMAECYLSESRNVSLDEIGTC